MFFNTLLAATAVATVLAVPIGDHHGDVHKVHTGDITTLGQAASQCGNKQQISCCNSGNKDSHGGLIGGVLGGLLGGNCSPLDITVLGVSVPISTACTNQVACCTGNSNGLLNLKCTQLVL